MFNYYLYETSFHGVGKEKLEENLKILNHVVTKISDKFDCFIYAKSLYEVHIEDTSTFDEIVYSELVDKFFQYRVLPSLLLKLKFCQTITDKIVFDSYFPNSNNAFWGIKFADRHDYELSSEDDYICFRKNGFKQAISPDNFWEYKDSLFPHLIFCNNVQSNMSVIASSGEFSGVINHLLGLNDFAKCWNSGPFDGKKLKAQVGLNVSPESKSVTNNENLRQSRTFTLPDGRLKYFEWHIKTANLRFHFYPDQGKHIIYVGYIGKHLPTKKYKM